MFNMKWDTDFDMKTPILDKRSIGILHAVKTELHRARSCFPRVLCASYLGEIQLSGLEHSLINALRRVPTVMFYTFIQLLVCENEGLPDFDWMLSYLVNRSHLLIRHGMSDVLFDSASIHFRSFIALIYTMTGSGHVSLRSQPVVNK